MTSDWKKRDDPDYLAGREHARLGKVAMLEAREHLTKGFRKHLALDALAHVLRALEHLEAAERHLVSAARSEGATWEQIGHVHGVTRQAAFKRFAVVDE